MQVGDVWLGAQGRIGGIKEGQQKVKSTDTVKCIVNPPDHLGSNSFTERTRKQKLDWLLFTSSPTVLENELFSSSLHLSRDFTGNSVNCLVPDKVQSPHPRGCF